MFNKSEKDRKKFDQKRLEDNLKLIDLIRELAVNNPSLRIGQILINYGFIGREEVCINHGRGYESMEYVWTDEFYTEPGTILKRVQDEIHRQANSTKR